MYEKMFAMRKQSVLLFLGFAVFSSSLCASVVLPGTVDNQPSEDLLAAGISSVPSGAPIEIPPETEENEDLLGHAAHHTTTSSSPSSAGNIAGGLLSPEISSPAVSDVEIYLISRNFMFCPAAPCRELFRPPETKERYWFLT